MTKNSIRKGIALSYLIALIAPTHDLHTGYPGQDSHHARTVDHPTVVSIHEVIRTINNDGDCHVGLWNTPEDLCSCCLMYNENKSSNKENADNIIAKCTQSNKCNASAIATIKQQYGLSATASSQELFNKLDDGILIKNMNVDKSLFGPHGAFTEISLPKFLAQAYNEKKLKNDDFSNEACLKAKKMDVQGSFNTQQLFLITSTCHPKEASMYIIKEAREGLKEATSLNKVAAYPGMKELFAPNTPPKGLPSLALPLAYFSYANGALHYIAAMPAAKGKVFCEVASAYRDDRSPHNAERIKRAYKILGNELVNYYKRFRKPVPGSVIGITIPLGDFHCFNIFYDEISGHFTFIDLETMAASLEHLASPADDILKLFLGLFSNTEPDARKNIIKGIDLKDWHNLAFKSFMESFKNAYQPDEQKQVLQELKKMFNSNATYPWLEIKDTELKNLRDNYINPVFDELMKE